MSVVLKVIGGKNDGREIAISVPRFIIGRGETAHLRPASDLVSREHCAIEISEDKVVVRDLNSRNGTFVNNNQLEGAHTARSGDRVRIGRLQFQLLVDPAKAGAKKPKVSGVIDAAARTAAKKKSSLEDSITDWLLEEGEDEEVPNTDERKVIASNETIQLNFEETAAFTNPKKDDLDESDEDLESEGDEAEAEGDDDAAAKKKKKKKAKPKKLPPIPKLKHESSTTAADDVLKKFFNRR